MDEGSIKKAFRMRCDGALLSGIAAELGYAESTISYALRGTGSAELLAGKKAELVTKIATALDAGRSYIQIADELGLKKNQIAGLINRNLRSSVRRQPAASSAKSAPATRGDTRRRVIASNKVAADTQLSLPPSPQPVPKAAPPIVASSPIPFALAGPGICGWPLWSATDTLPTKSVCGAACGREVYCPGHRALAYRPADARRRAA